MLYYEPIEDKRMGQIRVEMAKDAGGDMRGCNPAAGNIKAGLSTIEEKSLGCVTQQSVGPAAIYVKRPAQGGPWSMQRSNQA